MLAPIPPIAGLPGPKLGFQMRPICGAYYSYDDLSCAMAMLLEKALILAHTQLVSYWDEHHVAQAAIAHRRGVFAFSGPLFDG